MGSPFCFGLLEFGKMEEAGVPLAVFSGSLFTHCGMRLRSSPAMVRRRAFGVRVHRLKSD